MSFLTGLFGGGGGGGGGSDSHITMTQTNPVIPDEAKPLFNALMGIATGSLGSPVNFGRIPGLDAAPTRMPMANLGSMLTNPYFNAGASRTSPLFATGPSRPPNSGGGYAQSNLFPSGFTPPTNTGGGNTGGNTEIGQGGKGRTRRILRRQNRQNRLGDMMVG